MSAKENEKIEETKANDFKTQEIEVVETKQEEEKNQETVNNEEKKQEENKPKEEKEDKMLVEKETEKTAENKSKKGIYITFNIVVFTMLILFLSIVFALININKTTVINGVSIKDVNLSGLSLSDAKNKLEEAIKVELDKEINLIHNEKNILTFNPSEIEFTYEVNEIVKKAYQLGRNENIFINNFNILITGLVGKNFDLNYTYNEEKLNEIINSLDGVVEGLVENPSYYREDSNLIIVPGKDGIIIEKEQLKQLILDEIKNREYQKIINKEYNNKLDILVSDAKAENIDIEKIHKEIYSEPKDAYYIEEPFELFLDEDGVDFAITIEEAEKIIETPAEEYLIPLKLTKAKVTINDIGPAAFRYQVSTFTTNYDVGYTSRVNNLKLAASKINGKILKPGEIFSFNEVVGKRTVEAGYTNAPIFVNGQVEDGTGGGICQISTTLYNAVVLANLKIVDRRNHNYTTSYVKAGRDATVVYGAIDFKFQNTRKYPIKIEASVSGGVVRFTIYGVQEENEYTVKIIPVQTATIAKTTQYIDDPTLAEGSEVVKQVGASGCKVTTYKEVYLNGAFISKEVLSNDTYKAMNRIVRRGTKKLSVPTVSTPALPTTPTPTPNPQPEQPSTPEVSNTTN